MNHLFLFPYALYSYILIDILSNEWKRKFLRNRNQTELTTTTAVGWKWLTHYVDGWTNHKTPYEYHLRRPLPGEQKLHGASVCLNRRRIAAGFKHLLWRWSRKLSLMPATFAPLKFHWNFSLLNHMSLWYWKAWFEHENMWMYKL